MAKKVVTLYIDDTSLRLLVTRGKQIRNWADLPLEPGLVKSTIVIKEAEVAAKVKQLLKAQKVKAKKIIVGLSGLHCLSRPIILPQLPKTMLAEAVIREARRVLPIPLEQLYISWQAVPASEGKIHAFLVAVPRKTADALLKMLRQIGLKPYLMDIKPLALARVVKEPTAVIVDVQPTDFDIVIKANGVSQPIRTLPLPTEALSLPEKLPMIRNELDKTIQFYNSNNPERPLDSSVPIYVSGELAEEPELCQSLSAGLGYSISLMPSPLDCSELLAPHRYMANIGLALKELSSGEEVRFLVANLNVLPDAYRPKPPSLMRVFALPSAVIFIGLLILLVTLIQDASADIASIRSQLNATSYLLKQKLSQRQELTENITKLEKKLAEAEASGGNFITALDSLDKQNNGVNGDLAITLDNLPTTINLTHISYANNLLTINGSSSNETAILSYAESLDASDRFSEITIASIKKNEGMDFTLILKARR